MAVAEWRIDRKGTKEPLKATSRLRAPYRVLRAIFGDDGDATAQAISTSWLVKRPGTDKHVLLHDKQDEANRKFSLDAFRARPNYDWYVASKEEATIKEFCGWLSKEIIRRVEAEPQPKRLTATAKEKVNAAIAKGKSVQDAMKEHAEWEIIAPAAEAYRWPMKEKEKEPTPAPSGPPGPSAPPESS